MKKMALGSSPPLKSLYSLPTEDLKDEAPSELLEKARKIDVSLACQKGCDHIRVASLSEIRDEQWSQLYEKALILQWAKEFMNNYEKRHKKENK